MNPDRTARWDARYAASPDRVPAPARVLSEFAACLSAQRQSRGQALDLACGRAGNGEWLGRRGWQVTALDASAVVIEAIRARTGNSIAHARVHDIVRQRLPRDAFDVIVVARYLERDACADIAAALTPGGTLFYQTFSAGQRNPAFQLAPNELLALFPRLDVLHYADPPADADGVAEAMLVARDTRPADDSPD